MPDNTVLAIRHDIDTLYRKESFLLRLLGTLRPFICPFEILLKEIPEKKRVLDIGCGTGLVLNLLAFRKKIETGHGFDPNPKALIVARRVAKTFGLTNLRFFDENSPEPLPKGSYDSVLMIDVMHHVPVAHQKEIFTSAAARLLDGGRLIYKDMALHPFWSAWLNRLHDLILARQIIHYVPLALVETWAKEAKLKVIKRATMRRVFYVHEMLILEKST